MALPRAPGDAFKRRYFLLALAMCAWWQAVWELDARYDFFLSIPLMLGLPLLVTALVFTRGFLIDIFAYHWRGAASAVVAYGLTFSFCWWAPHNYHGCDVDVVDSLALPSSDWVVETRGELCAFAIDWGIDIRARNTKTQEIIVIAERGDVLDADLVYDWPNHVTIRFVTGKKTVPVNDVFGPFRVDYDYRPWEGYDDEEAYQSWLHDKRAPENIKWYCTYVLTAMSDEDRERISRNLAALNFPDGSRKSYCE